MDAFQMPSLGSGEGPERPAGGEPVLHSSPRGLDLPQHCSALLASLQDPAGANSSKQERIRHAWVLPQPCPAPHASLLGPAGANSTKQAHIRHALVLPQACPPPPASLLVPAALTKCFFYMSTSHEILLIFEVTPLLGRSPFVMLEVTSGH
eukprot:1161371-Pelagomonas_calceolata.AAC.6